MGVPGPELSWIYEWRALVGMVVSFLVRETADPEWGRLSHVGPAVC